MSRATIELENKLGPGRSAASNWFAGSPVRRNNVSESSSIASNPHEVPPAI